MVQEQIKFIIDQTIIFHDTRRIISKEDREEFEKMLLEKVGQIEPQVSLGDSQPMLLAEIIKLRKFMGEFIDVFNDGKVEQAYDALYDIEQRYSKQSN